VPKDLMLSKYTEEQIILNHLLGFTRDEIAQFTNVAAGSVSNKINEWKKRTEIADIDEIRQITTLIRKSGVNVRQCAKGFRLFQLLKKFNIVVEENEHIDSDIDDLTFFVNEIYLKCKGYGISPSTVNAWLVDLLNFTIKNYEYLYKEKSHPSGSVEPMGENNLVPSISLISVFIERKKRELEQIFRDERIRRNAIKEYGEQIKVLREEIAHLKREKESILTFHETFTRLEFTLKKDCDIDLRKDLKPFSKIFSDFKDNGYDVTSIVDQYEKATKLQWDIKFSENHIQALNKQSSGLQQNIRAYQSLLDMHRMNWDLYQKLEVMKFGIDELQQLWLTISEIIRNRSDPLKDFDRIENPVAFFIKDVEDNYHDKLKFEDRVKAKREELSMLNAQVNAGRQNLLAQPWIGSILLSLFKTGITEQDIVEMSHIFNEDQITPGLPVDDTKEEEISSYSSSNKEEKGWKKLREELKKYGGLKAAVNEQNDQLYKVEREYSSLVYQTQTLGLICQNIFNFINIMNASVSQYRHCKEAIRESKAYRCKNNWILVPIVILLTNDPKEDNNEPKTTVNESNKDYENSDVDNRNESENI